MFRASERLSDLSWKFLAISQQKASCLVALLVTTASLREYQLASYRLAFADLEFEDDCIGVGRDHYSEFILVFTK